MPIYEYDCPECGRFEVIQKISDKALKTCPQCAERGEKIKIERAVSAAAFHLKGSGWYKTDYASSGTAGTGKSNPKASAAPSTDSSAPSGTKEAGSSAPGTSKPAPSGSSQV